MARTKTTEKPKTTPKRKTVKAQPKKPPKKSREKVPPNEENILQPPFKKHCSYCGKPSTHAQILIAGPPPLFPYICDECVEVCVRVLFEDGLPDWRSRIISLLAIQPESKKMPPKQSETKQTSKKKVEKQNA